MGDQFAIVLTERDPYARVKGAGLISRDRRLATRAAQGLHELEFDAQVSRLGNPLALPTKRR